MRLYALLVVQMRNPPTALILEAFPDELTHFLPVQISRKSASLECYFPKKHPPILKNDPLDSIRRIDYNTQCKKQLTHASTLIDMKGEKTMKEISRVYEVNENGKYRETYRTTDKAEANKCFMHVLRAKYIYKVTYITRIERNNNYDGTETYKVYYNNSGQKARETYIICS